MKRYLVVIFLLGLSVSGFVRATKAGGQASQCTAFPCVVASVSLTDQTASVSQVPIFTPTTTGLYRVSYYEESSRIQGSVWKFRWNWTDDSITRSSGTLELDPGAYSNFGLPAMWVLAGQPITYSVTAGHNAAGTTYNLLATVEQLQ
jgi:hypothetical protein